MVTVRSVTLCVTVGEQWAESYGQQSAIGLGVYATNQQATGETMHAMQTQPQLQPQQQAYYPGIYNRVTSDGPHDFTFFCMHYVTLERTEWIDRLWYANVAVCVSFKACRG